METHWRLWFYFLSWTVVWQLFVFIPSVSFFAAKEREVGFGSDVHEWNDNRVQIRYWHKHVLQILDPFVKSKRERIIEGFVDIQMYTFIFLYF